LAILPTRAIIISEKGLFLINRPDGLETVNVDLKFNFNTFVVLEIDINHVNKHGRSNLSKADIAKIVIGILSGTVLHPSDYKVFGNELCSYFVKTSDFEDKNYKLVFCICSDKPDTIGIITLFRTR